MSRDDLITSVLGGPFRAFLELEPHMRKAVSPARRASHP